MKISIRIAGFLLAAAALPAWSQAVDLDNLVAQGAAVGHDRATGKVSFVGTENGNGRLGPPAVPNNREANARAHFDRFAPNFGLSSSADLRTLKVRNGPAGATVRFEQTINGVSVFASHMAVNTDKAGALRAIAGKVSTRTIDTNPSINTLVAARTATAIVARKYGVDQAGLVASRPVLNVYDPVLVGSGRPQRLVWKVVVTSAGRGINELVLVDAKSGTIALAFTQIHHARNRITYDTNSTNVLPGTFECNEAASDCTSGAIPDADLAHAYAADVYDFYASRFGRDAIDDAGGDMISTTRYCDDPVNDCPMGNAFWDGTQMVYGAGMVADDVVAHEFTHGITQMESGLIYFGEPGAINESLSDVFGEFVDLTNGKGNDATNVRWLMGEDSALGVIRSMSNPPAFNQPDKKSNILWYKGSADNAGVHTNSGVGNKAAFLIVDGGTFNGKTVTGIGIDKAAQIYYEAQTMLLGSGSNYLDLYNALFQACTNLTGLFGITANDCTQVRNATSAVEMNAASPVTTAKPFCAAGTSTNIVGADDFEGGGMGTLTRLTSLPSGQWSISNAFPGLLQGTYHGLATDAATVTDSSLVYQINPVIQAGDHFYFESIWDLDQNYDGVVVEYSINGGTSWVDANSLLVAGQGYNGTLLPGSALYPRRAFTGFLSDPVFSAYDLTTLAGKNVRWRFRLATDSTNLGIPFEGFLVDDVFHYQCSAGDFSLTSDAQDVVESAGNAIVTVSRGNGGSGAATVSYATANGTAIAGTDYTAKSGILSWTAGDARPKTISIPITNRSGAQASRAFTVSLSSPTGATLGAPTAQTITIGDFDGTIQFDSPTVSVNENGPNVTLTVVRNGFAGPAASVTWSTATQTATATSDFTTRTGTLTWVAGDASPKTISIGPVTTAGAYIPIVNDTMVEAPETFLVNLSAVAGAALGPTSSAQVTIVSEDNGVSMAGTTKSFVEGDGAQQIMVNRGGSTGAVDVNYTFNNGTAQNGTHFTGVNGSLHWNNGETGLKAIPVTILDDAVVNASRTFTVTLSGATGAPLSTPTTTVTIADNDNSLQFTAATASVLESTANVMLSVSRAGITAGQAAGVTWTINNGSALSGTDFGGPTTGTLSWAIGETAMKTITIPIINNATLNGSRTFTVTLSSPTGPNAVLGAVGTSTVTINDDERGVRFDQASYIFNEGTAATIKVKRMGPASTAMTATWATVNGSGVSGTDFGVSGSAAPRTGTISWAINDAADKTISIPTIQNTTHDQPNRDFTVTLTPGAGITLGSPGTTTVTIQDDDVTGKDSVRFDVAKLLVVENVGNAVLTVHRDDTGGGFARDITVKYATVAGTALAASDFTPVTNGLLHWGPGDSADKTISIAIVNNTVAEPTESFKVVLSAPSPGTTLGTPSEATITILDDDEVFPPDGIIPAGFSQTAAATKGWHVSNDPGAYEGALQLKTDEIDDGESAGLDMTGTFATGSVTFRVKISSEANFDVLTFYIDGTPMQSWSGTTVAGWQASNTFTITTPGLHTLRWLYVKDGSVSVGMDRAFLDALVTPGFTP